MHTRSEINKRITKEIESLDTRKEMKEFIKEILSFELDIIDRENARYTEAYNEIFSKIF